MTAMNLNEEIAADLRGIRQLRNVHDNVLGGDAREKLKNYFERIERLEEECAGLKSDIKDIFEDAKGNGFDVKAMRHVLKLRKMTFDERQTLEAIVDTYQHALGMLDQEARG